MVLGGRGGLMSGLKGVGDPMICSGFLCAGYPSDVEVCAGHSGACRGCATGGQAIVTHFHCGV